MPRFPGRVWRPVISTKPSRTSIAGRAASGVAWNFASGLSARALGLVGTLVLTRFLAPAEFGDVSAAVIVVETAGRFANYNLGMYVITRRTDGSLTFQAFVYHVAAQAVACLVITLLRHPIADALDTPGVARYIPWLALGGLLTQIARIPEATLYRDLRFRTLALTRALADAIYTIVSVGLAPFLRGGAIVAGNLARSLTSTITIISRSNRSEWFQPAALQFSAAKAMMKFGFPLSTRTLADSFSSSWDNLLVSRLFGNHIMGQYTLAYNLADVTGQMAEYITDVLLPSFSRLDADRQRLALPRIAAMMGLVLFPLLTGLAVVAPVVVAALLAPRWAGVAPMLAILCFRSLPIPFNAVFGSYFAARGRTQVIMYLGIAKLGLVLGGLLTLGRLGPLWACVAVVLAFLLSSILHLLVGWRLEQLPLKPLVASAMRPLLASAVMAAAVLLFRTIVNAWMPMPIWLDLVLEVCVGAVTYVAAAFLVARPMVLEFVEVVRSVISRRAATEEPPADHDPVA